ncbi:hypothetical protein HOF40_03385, partial [Candidatus Parcubacteria bacterium]|nr:hypothetical protein [Candidatus Parcubacteria bacterium]
GNIGWANMKSEWVDPVTSASPSPSPSTPPAPAAGLLICEQPAKKFVINPADGTGLALRDAPAAGSGATSITNMPNGAEVDRCANSPKNTTWYVVSYGGNIGWANMKSEWVDPVTSESPSPSAAGTPAGGTASPASTYSCQPPECTPLKNPLGTVDAIPVIFGNVIKALTGFMGSAALLVFIYGGVMWIMSGGNAERVKKGNQAMIWAVVGIVVIFSSYAIITLVIEGMGAL